MIWKGVVLKIIHIKCMVCLQQLHYPLSRSCVGGIDRNIDSIVTRSYLCPANDPKTDEFQCSPYRAYSLYDISNTNFQGSTYFYPVGTKIDTCVFCALRMHSFENGTYWTHSLYATHSGFLDHRGLAHVMVCRVLVYTTAPSFAWSKVMKK